jgi:hypothetical protein
MLNLTSAVILSIINMAYASIIYLSLHGWIVQHEPSGMQLLMHVFVTAPIVLVTTIWLFSISRPGKCSTKFWKLNLVGILVPIMSIQTGVTHYHYDKVGLAVTVLVPIALIALFIGQVRQHESN